MYPLDLWFEDLGGLTHIEGNLHRSPIPTTPDHFQTLKSAGIEVIFSLEETVSGTTARRFGFDWRPHFWTDDAPVRPEQMDRFIEEYVAVPEDAPVVVHCIAGWGRAGSAASCALVAKYKMTADQAMRHFWSRVPDAERIMVRNRQADMVRAWAARRLGRGL